MYFHRGVTCLVKKPRPTLVVRRCITLNTMTNKKFGVGRSIKVETKDLIKELRILEKSSKLGEQACICGEAANRLEELLQEIEISRRLEKSENHKENGSKEKCAEASSIIFEVRKKNLYYGFRL